jgi:hypothetical protein
VGFEVLALVFEDIDICTTPKHSEHGDVWFSTKEGFVWRGIWHSDGRKNIEDANEVGDGFSPKRRRQASLVEHGSDTLLDGSIQALSNAILLGSGSIGGMVDDASI